MPADRAGGPSRAELPLHLARLVDIQCDRFDDALKANRKPRLEEFLRSAPEAARPELLHQLLQSELNHRGRLGEKPGRAEYQARLEPLGPWVLPVLDELLPAPPCPPAPAGLVITLAAVEGPNKGEVHSFDQHDTFLVGRAVEAHFSLPDDPYFSRLHFMVEVNPPCCRVMDLESRNHTFVNGQQIKSADLKQGDRITAGTTTFEVSIQQPARAEPQPPADPRRQAETLALAKPPPLPTLPPTTAPALPAIPGFTLLRVLGEGGMGVVYLAHRDADGREVALKTIRPALAPTEDTVSRFLREAEVLRRLQHPYIVAFQEQGAAGGLLYLAMDYIPGTDAANLLQQKGPLPIGRAVRLTCQLLEALAYAHALAAPIIHRDVKPSNLLLAQRDGRETAILADFGLARTYQDSPLSGLTMTGLAGGTVDYMPPEQVRSFRKVTPAADQYSSAATLFKLLTGQSVHGKGNSKDLFCRIVLDKPARLTDLCPEAPAALADALERALAKEPGRRFRDVTAFRQALLPYADG